GRRIRSDDRGVVDENIDLAEMPEGLLGGRFDAREIGDVDRKPPDIVAPGEALDGRVEQSAVAIPDAYAAARSEDAAGDRETDTLRPAGDDRDAPFQVVVIHRVGFPAFRRSS